MILGISDISTHDDDTPTIFHSWLNLYPHKNIKSTFDSKLGWWSDVVAVAETNNVQNVLPLLLLDSNLANLTLL